MDLRRRVYAVRYFSDRRLLLVADQRLRDSAVRDGLHVDCMRIFLRRGESGHAGTDACDCRKAGWFCFFHDHENAGKPDFRPDSDIRAFWSPGPDEKGNVENLGAGKQKWMRS